MEAVEAFTSTDNGNFHVFPWRLPQTSMEVNLLPPTSLEISMEANLLPPTAMETPMEVDRKSDIMWRALLATESANVDIFRLRFVASMLFESVLVSKRILT